ncbi:hypothetical protein ABIB25_002637 [Nakamurella sp. UYEF19]|uniref:hypothetical protein n=1 Tax=Nakamurella sp. UYEF19 TaxID=1756392 RepID=UPI0033944FEB
MTQLGELAGDRIELNPEVPFPPFPIWLRVPSTWSQLDSNPGTWRRSADDLIDTTFRGSRVSSKERREIVALLEGLVADCQRAGAALSLITVGKRAEGGAASFGLHIAFASDGRPTSLGRVHDILPRTGTVTEITTNTGPAILHRDRMTMVVPGTAAIAALTSLQIFLPVPDTSWTILLSTASAHPELTDQLEMLLRTAAQSIRTGEDGSVDEVADPDLASDAPGPAAKAADVDWTTPTDSTPRPGYERGFGTTVLRRLDPPGGTAADSGNRDRGTDGTGQGTGQGTGHGSGSGTA